MLVTCWSVKGGSGTTVVAAALALLIAPASPGGALLVDAGGGDLAPALGLADPVGAGLGSGLDDWLASRADGAALRRLEVDAGGGIGLLTGGAATARAGGYGTRSAAAEGHVVAAVDPGRAGDLVAALLGDARPVIVDAGDVRRPLTAPLSAASAASLLVIRPCYLALRRAIESPVRPTGVVLVQEEGRSLRRSDVEAALGVPVRAQIDIDPAVARMVDAGLLGARLPRALARSLRRAA